MCGFIIHKRDHTKVNGMKAIDDMSYRGLRTKYRGYKCWKEYDLLHTALPMVDPDPEIAIQPMGSGVILLSLMTHQLLTQIS